MKSMIADNQDFNLTMLKADPGKGSSQHDHETIECFVALTGSWAVTLGMEGEGSDTGAVRRIFRAAGNHARASQRWYGTGTYSCHSRRDRSGKATWSPHINERAKELGLFVNEDEDLVDTR